MCSLHVRPYKSWVTGNPRPQVQHWRRPVALESGAAEGVHDVHAQRSDRDLRGLPLGRALPEGC